MFKNYPQLDLTFNEKEIPYEEIENKEKEFEE